MILKEKLERMIPRNIYVKIGSNSGFIYCEKCDENIIETITRISQDYYFGLLDKIQKIEHYLSEFDNLWDNRIELLLRQWIKSREKQPTARMIEKFKEKLEIKKQKDLNQKITFLKKVQEEEKQFTPFLERKVLKTYDSWFDEFYHGKTKIIIFEGKERGPFWSIDEYREGVTEDEIQSI